jgi:hypothetical protein
MACTPNKAPIDPAIIGPTNRPKLKLKEFRPIPRAIRSVPFSSVT